MRPPVRRMCVRAALLAGAFVLGGCAGSAPPPVPPAESLYQEAQKDLQRGRCTEAIEKYQRLISNYPGSALAPDAQYFLAEAHFCAEDYVSAVFEYQRLIDTYPASEWVDEAQYQIAEAYFEQSRRAELDQSETRDALSHYRTFLDDNPQSPRADQARARIVECRDKLARKLLLTARLYKRQRFLEAARLSYVELLDSYADTQFHYPAMLELGDVLEGLGKPDEARQRWSEVARDSPDAELQKQASERLAAHFQTQND